VRARLVRKNSAAVTAPLITNKPKSCFTIFLNGF
jgi:hypothetical protein